MQSRGRHTHTHTQEKARLMVNAFHKWCERGQMYSIISWRNESKGCAAAHDAVKAWSLVSRLASTPVWFFHFPPVLRAFALTISRMTLIPLSVLHKHSIKALRRGVGRLRRRYSSELFKSGLFDFKPKNTSLTACCSLSSSHNGSGRTAETQDRSFIFTL